MAKGVKDGLFQVFLFFFYNQVLGLDPFITGIALTLALVFDSISDPLVGAWTDQHGSEKWGRRHPFMFASAIPLGITLYLLFIPPDGLGPTGLFWWLTSFAILVRLSLTLFLVPAMSLGAEMSTDYEERTSVTTYRISFGSFISPFVIFIGFTTFFAANAEFSNGMFRASSYPKFALFAGIAATLSILISTYFTKSIIPHLPQLDSNERFTVKALWTAFTEAISLSSYRNLITYILILYIAIGIGIIFSPYYVTYFFSLAEKEFGLILLAPAPAGILAFIFAPLLNKFWDKKNILIVSTILTGFFFSSPYNLRFLDLFPSNESPHVFVPFFILICLGYACLWISVSISHSMMADTVDEYQLNYGSRKEGMFFASLTLAYKATVGLGSFFAGILLKLIEFPEKANAADVPTEAIMGIGYVGGPLVFFIYLLSVIPIFFYTISRERHESIQNELANK